MFESVRKPIWWLPSFGLMLFIAIMAWMVVQPERLFLDPAVGRHLRTAESILEMGQIPRTDPLSFTKPGAPWIDFEWAFEATLGELYRVGGLPLDCAFCGALFAATILGIYRMLVQSGFSLSTTLVGTSIVFLTLQPHFLARPVLFTYLFMALVVEVWSRRTQPILRDWLILPVVFVAWANLHAGWFAGLVFLTLAIVGRTLDRILHRVSGEEAPLILWIALMLLCAFATSFNPWGWALHRHVFEVATSLKSAALWDEYQPPNFGAPSMTAITVLFILAVVFIARTFKRAPLWRWEVIVPVFVFLYEGLKAQRHVLLLIEVAVVPLARDLDIILHGTWLPYIRERLREFQAQQRIAGGDAWLAIIAALVIAIFFVKTHTQEIPVGGIVTPKLIAFLRDNPDHFHRPLTTTWNAGPLLWNMRPDLRVSIDDRGDFYGDKTIFAFVDTINGAAGWQKRIEDGHYDSLILDPYLQLNQLLHFLPEWKEVYRDDHVVIYWQNPPAN